MSEWIKHDGRSQPIDDEVDVEVKFGESGEENDRGPAGLWCWYHDEFLVKSDCHITHYRIIDNKED